MKVKKTKIFQLMTVFKIDGTLDNRVESRILHQITTLKVEVFIRSQWIKKKITLDKSGESTSFLSYIVKLVVCCA